MNAVVHAEISSRRWKAPVEDFIKIHDFIDCTKEIESTNLHRWFHTLYGIKNIMIPIFGHTLITSNGKKINVKDMLESDHILADYHGKFIPTLADFVSLCRDDINDSLRIETFYSENSKFFTKYPEIRELLLSPLWNTGKIKSLLLTHNSWFIGKIVPLIFDNVVPEIKNYSIAPNEFFSRCEYSAWVQNGHGYPPSFEKIESNKKKKLKLIPASELPKEDPLNKVVFDGSFQSQSTKDLKAIVDFESRAKVRNIMVD